MPLASPRSLLVIALLLAGCGAASPAPPPQHAQQEVRAPLVPFHVTLPSGHVLALAASGAVTLDGETIGSLQEDGRFESNEGDTLAALLPDGRISYDGELTGDRVEGARLVEGATPILELAQDTSLTVRRPSGDVVATVPVIGVTPASRTTVLYVLGVVVLATSGPREDEVTELVQDGEAVRVRVLFEGRPTLGPDDAPVTIVLFDDFQCPFCARAVPTIDRLVELYPGQIRLVFMHEPLPFHDHAADAAALAEEAFAQRGSAGFWEAYHLLFENQGALDVSSLHRYGAQLRLDPERVRRALEEGTHDETIDDQYALAESLGALGTPTFFINGRPLRGAQPIEAFRTIVDEELRLTREMSARGVRPGDVYAWLMRDALARVPAEEHEAAPPRPQLDPSAVYAVPIGSAPVRGPADALVTIVVFSDFECPFCSRVLPTLERIEETYGRDVRFVFRHNPLPFHPNALPAAEAAAEAYAQRGARAFWRMHDLLFANQTSLARADLDRYAAQLHLDARRFARALDDHTHGAAIEADQALARQLGATGTPSFFINGRLLRGAQPFDAFQQVIDDELARARALVSSGTPRRSVYEAVTRDGASEPVYLAAP